MSRIVQVPENPHTYVDRDGRVRGRVPGTLEQYLQYDTRAEPRWRRRILLTFALVSLCLFAGALQGCAYLAPALPKVPSFVPELAPLVPICGPGWTAEDAGLLHDVLEHDSTIGKSFSDSSGCMVCVVVGRKHDVLQLHCVLDVQCDPPSFPSPSTGPSP